jgi:glucose dehydrogenase
VKLLFDENLSPQLIDDLYPGSAHVHQCGLGSILVIAAGGHGKLGTKQGDYVTAFTLP